MFSRFAEVRAGVGNTFGNVFRVTTYGESHGGGVGCIIDGCPPRLPLTEVDMQFELDRRWVSWIFVRGHALMCLLIPPNLICLLNQSTSFSILN